MTDWDKWGNPVVRKEHVDGGLERATAIPIITFQDHSHVLGLNQMTTFVDSSDTKVGDILSRS